jgi:fatty-acyl-CoA synthase
MTFQERPRTLVDALHRVRGETQRGFTFLDRDLQPSHWPFSDLVAECERRGSALRTLGLQRGDRVALILPEGEDFVLSFLGAILAGIVPVPMYPPASLARAAAYLETTQAILRSCGARVLVTTAEGKLLASQLLGGESPLREILTVDQLSVPFSSPSLLEDPAPEDICFLQYTSGSTALPKGVVVQHRNVVANGWAIMRDGLQSDCERDRGLSWLPLYHDMGLIGFVLAPLLVGVPVVFVPTLSFVKQPSVWLKLVSGYRATITFAPNFAFGLCVKRARHDHTLDLSCLRVLGCGAEPIHAQTIRDFLAHYRPHGLSPNALVSCYGMAEATLAIAFERLDEPFRTLRIDRDAYCERGEIQAGELELASCGSSFPGHQLAIVGEDGRMLPEGRVGEVLFRGPSVTAGYYGDQLATRAAQRDGWLYTGDLGFLSEGRLYISGRKKDLVILHGRNYYPQAIEWEVEQLAGVRPGSAVAFASEFESSERLVIVVEGGGQPSAQELTQLQSAIRARISSALGIAVERVLVAKQSTVPRTTSGKLQRRKTRALFEAGALIELRGEPARLQKVG